MRTTVRLQDDLLAQVRRHAAETRRTLTQVIEDALRAALARREGGARRRPVRLTTCGGSGLLPGVDLDDTASLLDLMETGRAPARR